MDYGRVACYLRVSTSDQKTASQLADIERWLSNHGYDRDAVAWYEEQQSGATLKRPAFEAMQNAIFMGELDTVVVWHADRIIRDHKQGVNLIHDWAERGIRLVSINQAVDLDSTMSRAVAGLLFGVAQNEREQIKARQRAGIEAAKERGVYKGRKPGSLKKPEGVKKAAELREKGVSIADICKIVGIGRTTCYDYLRLAKEAEHGNQSPNASK